MLSNNIKIINFLPRESASVKLFVFSHAGGNATFYHGWAIDLPDFIDIFAVSLPGRGSMLTVSAITDWNALITQTVNAIIPLLDGTPYCLFGHSFGSLFAYEVSKELILLGFPEPLCLFTSAHGAPQIQAERQKRISKTYDLPDEDFLLAAKQWGFLDEELLQNNELVQIMLPALRADLKLDETYAFDTSRPKLRFPLIVYGGNNDKSVNEEELSKWLLITDDFADHSVFNRVVLFEGGHFYLVEKKNELLKDISTTITSLLNKIPKSITTKSCQLIHRTCCIF